VRGWRDSHADSDRRVRWRARDDHGGLCSTDIGHAPPRYRNPEPARNFAGDVDTRAVSPGSAGGQHNRLPHAHRGRPGPGSGQRLRSVRVVLQDGSTDLPFGLPRNTAEDHRPTRSRREGRNTPCTTGRRALHRSRAHAERAAGLHDHGRDGLLRGRAARLPARR